MILVPSKERGSLARGIVTPFMSGPLDAEVKPYMHKNRDSAVAIMVFHLSAFGKLHLQSLNNTKTPLRTQRLQNIRTKSPRHVKASLVIKYGSIPTKNLAMRILKHARALKVTKTTYESQ